MFSETVAALDASYLIKNSDDDDEMVYETKSGYLHDLQLKDG